MVWFLWLAQFIVAGIFLQTLYFKFTGAPESIFIFTKIGLEPLGRYAIGVAELIASILVLIPRTTLYGAILALVIIIPAIVMHLTKIGIVVQGDGGLLFGLAIAVMIASLFIIAIKTGVLKI